MDYVPRTARPRVFYFTVLTNGMLYVLYIRSYTRSCERAVTIETATH